MYLESSFLKHTELFPASDPGKLSTGRRGADAHCRCAKGCRRILYLRAPAPAGGIKRRRVFCCLGTPNAAGNPVPEDGAPGETRRRLRPFPRRAPVRASGRVSVRCLRPRAGSARPPGASRAPRRGRERCGGLWAPQLRALELPAPVARSSQSARRQQPAPQTTAALYGPLGNFTFFVCLVFFFLNEGRRA